MNTFQDIKNVLYINLDYRTDRRANIEYQLKTLNLNATRFDAIKNPNGAVGCLLSHIACIEIAIKNNYSHVLILEDDAMFINSTLLIDQFNKFISLHKHFDVLLLGANNQSRYAFRDDTCIKVQKAHSAVAYLVNGHYMEKLLDNFKNSLIKNIEIDVGWHDLQHSDNFYLLLPLTVSQLPNYSDIEKKYMNYNALMLQLKY